MSVTNTGALKRSMIATSMSKLYDKQMQYMASLVLKTLLVQKVSFRRKKYLNSFFGIGYLW